LAIDPNHPSIVALLNTEPTELRRLLEGPGAELRRPEFEETLRSMAMEARKSGDTEGATYFHWYSDLLKNCRERGISTVFDEMEAAWEAAGEALKKLVWQFLRASPAEQRHLLEAYSDDLLRPEAISFLRSMVEQARLKGDSDAERLFHESAEILADCRERGVSAAFDTLENATLTEIQDLTSRFLRAGPVEICHLLRESGPKLLRPEVEATLRKIAEQAAAKGDTNAEAAFRSHADVLKNCREHGVLAVLEGVDDTLGEPDAPAQVPPLLRELAALKSAPDAAFNEASLRRREHLCRAILSRVTQQNNGLLWAKIQNELGVTLCSIGGLRTLASAAEASVAAHREALKVRIRERLPIEWIETQTDLGDALQLLGILRNEIPIVDAAIETYREVLNLVDPITMPFEWADIQSRFGQTLCRLGNLRGDTTVLDAAVAVHRKVLRECTRERRPQLWARTQNELGIALTSIGDLRRDTVSLAAAVAAFREALTERTRERTPMGWAATQSNLGGALMWLGYLHGNIATIEASVSAHRESLKEHTRDHTPANWATVQNNLGRALNMLGELCRDTKVLEASATAFREALKERTRDRAPIEWARIQGNLGDVLSFLGNLCHDTAVLEQAAYALQASLSVYEAGAGEYDRQRIAVSLIQVLIRLGRDGDALTLIGLTLARSEAAIADAMLSRNGKLEALGQVDQLYGLLSRLRLLEAGPDATPSPQAKCLALEVAEAGRARLLAKMLASSHDGKSAISDRGRQTDSTDTLTSAQILAAAPKGGALVLPVLTAAGTHIFIARDSAEEPDLLILHTLTRDSVVAQLAGENGWLSRYYHYARAISGRTFQTPPSAEVSDTGGVVFSIVRDTDAPNAGTESAYEQWNETVRGVQAWLWNELVGPVHDALLQHLSPGAHVVFAPPGILALLPLTAAGPVPDGRFFHDYWTASLTPSVRTIQVCRERIQQVPPARLLGVFDPPPRPPVGGGRPPPRLTGARMEARMLRARCARAGLETVSLIDKEASWAAVRRHMRNVGYFHASTHGMHHPYEPERSALQLADGDLLRPSDLNSEELRSLRLVYLSACETALAGAWRAAEEYIGLGVAFVAAGAAGVIGTLWPIFDDTAFLMADRFYELHFGQGEDGRGPLTPAAALREAQKWLRDVTFRELRERFPVVAHGNRTCLLIGAPISQNGQVGPGPTDEYVSQAFVLPLGPDAEKPFWRPHEWAAYIMTGL
jgi:tetratricopeptide (TPR) repeat protein